MEGVSPVVATVIIVSIAIVLAIATALWMAGVTTTFTRFEQLEVVAAYPIYGDEGFNVYVVIKNTGSTPATIDMVFVNGRPYNSVYVNTTSGWLKLNSYTIDPGGNATLKIVLGESYGHGQAIEVKIHTVSGREYPKTIVLP